MMSHDEFAALKQDIAANGLRIPVLLYENKILDGRNRYAACREVGVKADTIQYVGNDPVGHVISLNLMRRHLNTSQRAMISLKIAHYKNGGIRVGQNTLASQTANLPTEASQLEVAKLLQISPRIIRSAINLQKKAAHELIEMVENGTLTINAAQTIAALANHKQAVVIARIAAAHDSDDEFPSLQKLLAGQGDNDRYTPAIVIDAVRHVLGTIDLDPASCAVANQTVQALKYYTIQDDGLKQAWYGKVFLNPPYIQPQLILFAEKLVGEYEAGNVTEAILLTHNWTEALWWHQVVKLASAVCFSLDKLPFLDAAGKRERPSNHGQTFVYIGAWPDKFAQTFEQFGTILFCKPS